MADLPGVTPPVTEDWLASVAGKKIAWAIAKILAAKALSYLATPALVSFLKTAEIDPATLANVAPVFIFGVLVAIHDAVKLKTGWKFL